MTRCTYTPRGYASAFSDLMLSVPRCNAWLPPGLGKTVLTLTVLDFLHNTWGESAPTLVLAPLRVARDTWPNESTKWAHLAGLDVVSVTGSLEERVAALRRPAAVYATNYDVLPWLRDWFKEQGKAWPFRRVIADESTKLKGFRIRQGGVRAQALAEVAHTVVKEWVNLTGTPSPNGLKDLWGQQWFVDEGKRLGRTFSAFEQRWFAMKPHHPGAQYGTTIVMPGADEQIHARLADCTLAIDPRDWFDLKEPIVNVIEVTLPASARKKYRELEKEMFTRLESGEEVEVFNAAALTNKCLQCANGAVYLDVERYGTEGGEPKTIEVHDAKLDALESLLNDLAGASLMVAYHFRSDLARLQRTFPEGVDLATPEGLHAFRTGEARLGFGHPASIGHGIDGLQNVCNAIAFFAQDWNLETHDQIIERIGPVRQMQAGLDRPVFIHYLVAQGTLDEVVMARRTSKRGVQDLLMAYMKEQR